MPQAVIQFVVLHRAVGRERRSLVGDIARIARISQECKEPRKVDMPRTDGPGAHGIYRGIFEGGCFDEEDPFPVENQSVAVDVVTGATLTSQAIIDAVADCIAQAGGSEADFRAEVAPAEKSTAVIDLDCDVVIVGAGGSGMSAAMAANQAGAKVVIVEKAASIGGSSAMSMGMGAVGSSMQAASEMGQFTVTQWMRDWMAQQNYMVSAPMIYKYMTESGKTVDWLLENGIEMNYTGHEPRDRRYRLHPDPRGPALGGPHRSDREVHGLRRRRQGGHTGGVGGEAGRQCRSSERDL